MPKIREIQLVDDGTVRGSITDKYSINILVRYSDLIKFLRNAREFNRPLKSNEEGVLRIPFSKDVISDARIDDMVSLLNGEKLYEYENARETMFRKKVFNKNMDRNFRESMYTALQYFLLPENILEKLLKRRTVAPRIGEYEDEIETIMKRREHNIKNRLNNTISTPEFRAQYPIETLDMTQSEFEKWLRSNGLQQQRNHRPEEHYVDNNEFENWNDFLMSRGYSRNGRYGYFRGGIKHKTRSKKYKQKQRKTRKHQ